MKNTGTKTATSQKSKGFGKSIATSYLVAFNLFSTLGWSLVLILLLDHLFASSIPPATSTKYVPSFVSHFIPTLRSARDSTATEFGSHLPAFLRPLYHRACTAYNAVGAVTAIVQSLAIFEVIHAAIGIVRTPLITTLMQVSSRLVLVWAIVEQFPSTHTNPLYATMVLAWSLTEVVRYPFYAVSLVATPPAFFVRLRYTTFYVLYILGAASEAFLMYSTLPLSRSSPIPGTKGWVPGVWGLFDYFRGALFLIWWPGLYVMYTYMVAQRRKVLSPNRDAKRNGLKAQ